MRTGLIVLASSLVASLLVGCVQAPVELTPELDTEVPERWAAATGTAGDEAPQAEAEWWRSFGDPELDRLIETALERNPDLAAAEALVRQAEAATRIAGADLKPSVSAGLSGSRGRQNFIGFPFPGTSGVLSSTSTQLGLSTSVSWEADLWGRLRAGARASLADLQAIEADYAGFRLSLGATVARVWFRVAELNEQVALGERSVAALTESRDFIKRRYEAGLGVALDYRQSSSALAAAEAELTAARGALATNVRLLETLLGQYPSTALAGSTPAPAIFELPAPVPAGIPADLVARRPDLVAAERRLAASEQRILVARRSLYPRLSLTASGGTSSNQLKDLLDGDFRVWSVVGNLLQPLFQGGRLRAGVDLAEASGEQALAIYVASVLDAYAEVENALTVEQTLLRQVEHVGETALQSNAAWRLADERYRAGIGDYLRVLDAQRTAITADSRLLTVRRELLDNRVNLHLALGGGFRTTTATDDSSEEPPS